VCHSWLGHTLINHDIKIAHYQKRKELVIVNWWR
jgi:hypothetical protein